MSDNKDESSYVYRVFMSHNIGENVKLSRPAAIFILKENAIDYAIYQGECGIPALIDEFVLDDCDDEHRIWLEDFNRENNVAWP